MNDYNIHKYLLLKNSSQYVDNLHKSIYVPIPHCPRAFGQFKHSKSCPVLNSFNSQNNCVVLKPDQTEINSIFIRFLALIFKSALLSGSVPLPKYFHSLSLIPPLNAFESFVQNLYSIATHEKLNAKKIYDFCNRRLSFFNDHQTFILNDFPVSNKRLIIRKKDFFSLYFLMQQISQTKYMNKSQSETLDDITINYKSLHKTPHHKDTCTVSTHIGHSLNRESRSSQQDTWDSPDLFSLHSNATDHKGNSSSDSPNISQHTSHSCHDFQFLDNCHGCENSDILTNNSNTLPHDDGSNRHKSEGSESTAATLTLGWSSPTGQKTSAHSYNEEQDDNSTTLYRESWDTCLEDVNSIKLKLKETLLDSTPPLFRLTQLKALIKTVTQERLWPREFIQDMYKIFDIDGLRFYCKPKRQCHDLRLIGFGCSQSSKNELYENRDSYFLHLNDSSQTIGIATIPTNKLQTTNSKYKSTSYTQELMLACYNGTCTGLLNFDNYGRNKAHSLGLWAADETAHIGTGNMGIACMDLDGSGLEYCTMDGCTLAILSRARFSGLFEIVHKTSRSSISSSKTINSCDYNHNYYAQSCGYTQSKSYDKFKCDSQLSHVETGRIPVKEGDLVLLGSNGFWDNLSTNEICELVSLAISPVEAMAFANDIRLASFTDEICMCLMKAAYIKLTRFMGNNYELFNHKIPSMNITLIVGWITSDKVSFNQELITPT